MVKRLDVDTKNPERPRRELDQRLDVRSWRTFGRVGTRVDRHDNAPPWWHGDEDASQSFLAAMGILT